ncbi:MAG: NTP transferase domain-containing protein [Rickettsiaceae bacterium]
MQIIILAAGKGSRMNSTLPKVMHEVGGVPMLERVVQNCYKVTRNLILVYSDHLLPYLHLFTSRCQVVNQTAQLGTAHAVSVARNLMDDKENIGVIYGDNPLINDHIIKELFNHLTEAGSQAATLAFENNQPSHYGRIILDSDGEFQSIIESKYATEEEKKITLCNSGIMAFAPSILKKYINKCLAPSKIDPARELYLTDIIAVCRKENKKISYYKSPEHQLMMGVNTQEELHKANNLVKQK